MASLHLLVRTPDALVAELDVVSLRVPTESGQVGLRPRGEPTVLPIEPGLVLARIADALRFLGTAGGIVRSDGREALLLTPIAVVGEDGPAVLARLDAALAVPSPEREFRRAITNLESGIVHELRRRGQSGRDGGGA